MTNTRRPCRDNPRTNRRGGEAAVALSRNFDLRSSGAGRVGSYRISVAGQFPRTRWKHWKRVLVPVGHGPRHYGFYKLPLSIVPRGRSRRSKSRSSKNRYRARDRSRRVWIGRGVTARSRAGRRLTVAAVKRLDASRRYSPTRGDSAALSPMLRRQFDQRSPTRGSAVNRRGNRPAFDSTRLGRSLARLTL